MFTKRLAFAALAVSLLGGMARAPHAASLPQLVIDKSQTTVSGLSSGGFMAVQLHVAYSATFKTGAGVVAGGPFYCAEDSVVNATGRCMKHDSSIPVSSLVSTTNSWASSGYLDAVSGAAPLPQYLALSYGGLLVDAQPQTDAETAASMVDVQAAGYPEWEPDALYAALRETIR